MVMGKEKRLEARNRRVRKRWKVREDKVEQKSKRYGAEKENGSRKTSRMVGIHENT